MQVYKLILTVASFFCVLHIEAMEVSQAGKKLDVFNSQLSSKQQREFREAIMGIRNMIVKMQNSALSEAEMKQFAQKEAVIDKYLEAYPNDSFVVEKMKNHGTFLRKLEKEQMSQSKLAQSQLGKSELKANEEIAECSICLEEKPTVTFPCKNGNQHTERVCQSCLDDVVRPTGICPICREKLIK